MEGWGRYRWNNAGCKLIIFLRWVFDTWEPIILSSLFLYMFDIFLYWKVIKISDQRKPKKRSVFYRYSKVFVHVSWLNLILGGLGWGVGEICSYMYLLWQSTQSGVHRLGLCIWSHSVSFLLTFLEAFSLLLTGWYSLHLLLLLYPEYRCNYEAQKLFSYSLILEMYKQTESL